MSGASKPIPASHTSLQNANWSGRIPVLLSLAPTSLSSPTPPRPLHTMIPRASYLHVALRDEVMQLAGHAPVAAGLASGLSGMRVEEPPDSGDEDGGEADVGQGKEGSGADADEKESSETPTETEQPGNIRQAAYPDCWFEDAESGVPLRWHLLVGVLYDLMKGRAVLSKSSRNDISGQSTQQSFLPWKIKVHFASYPTDLLPLDDGGPQPTADGAIDNADHSSSRITNLVGRIFRNSLKQALFLQYGSSKVAMSITKSSHEQIWEAVLQSDYASYHKVNAELQSGVKEAAIDTQSSADPTVAKEDENDIPQLIPVRLMLNGMPAIQRPIKHAKESEEGECKRPMEVLETLGTIRPPQYTTLGNVLSELLPQHFALDPATGGANPIDSAVFFIQGVQPSTTCALVDLWRACSHPDHFLYITVVTES